MFSFCTKRFFPIVFSAIILSLTTSCKKDKDPDPSSSSSDSKKQEVVNNYAEIVYASYVDSYNKGKDLQTKINAFLSEPSEQKLNEAKQAWLDARVPYLQTEAYRFYDGPIDDPANGVEGLLNAWPMDESYIDYVEGNENAGIINDLTVDLTKENLTELNEGAGTSETSISVGYHAIEFLLWGQDFSNDGPGNRPYTDFVDGGTAKNQERRVQYLKAIADILVDDLKYLVDSWAPGTNNYRKTFEGDVNGSLKNILFGFASLSGGELAGERMQVALESGQQEDEHSCFSDNTHNDIIYDALGLDNVYYGRYTKLDGTTIDGPGIDELIAAKDADLSNKMNTQLATTKTSVNAIHHPFDQEINDSEGKKRIQTAIESLYKQADLLTEIAAKLGISFNQ